MSPLLLAASSDLLLERIGRLCGAFRRAYADDTAVILKDGLASAGALADVFTQFARISGMRINVSKTIVVPPVRSQAGDPPSLPRRGRARMGSDRHCGPR